MWNYLLTYMWNLREKRKKNQAHRYKEQIGDREWGWANWVKGAQRYKLPGKNNVMVM